MPLVFGYGSLICPRSANRTLRRPRPPADLRPAVLHGYERVWQLVVPLAFDADPNRAARPGVFLDIAIAPGAGCLGAVFSVSPDELARLDRREAEYDRLDVTRLIDPPPAQTVYAYRGRPAHTRPPADAVIPRRYWRLVEDAAARYGPAFARRFAASTRPTRLPLADGHYRAVRHVRRA